MNLAVCSCFLGLFLIAISEHESFAQSLNSTEQITLSGDLENNPTAQDILKKIEQTKRWIKELEERNYEGLEAKKELDAKRFQALEKLNHDLQEWELLWEYYSPRNAFSRFVETVPNLQIKEVFWDQFEFHQIKVDAGRAALKKVIANGGSLSEGRQAYHTAAETKRIELIEANSIFNINHNLAYYNQQILFNSEGQYFETPVTGEHLRKYYEDYRTNPAYLQANPDDKVSWDEIGQTTPNTECRKGSVVVHRFHASDYVCVSINTAEMWIRHGMGEITGNSVTSDNNLVTPLTKCNDGFTVIYSLESKKYSCILQETANLWINEGNAEYHDPHSFIFDKIQEKETSVTILGINRQLQEFEEEFTAKKAEIKMIYDQKYADALTKSKKDEKNAIKDLNGNEISKEETISKIMQVRQEYDSTQANLLKEKMIDLDNLENLHKENLKKFTDSYEFNPYIKIIWDSELSQYEAVMKN